MPPIHGRIIARLDASFESFVADMKVDNATHEALTERFDALTTAERARFLDSLAVDPLSVLEFEEATEPTIVSAPSDGAQTRAASSRYTATY